MSLFKPARPDPTKQRFIDTYRQLIRNNYVWAEDTEKLDRYMANVEVTIRMGITNVDLLHATMAKRAWKDIGCKGPISYKSLRALPDPDQAKSLFNGLSDPSPMTTVAFEKSHMPDVTGN